ncbi:MAG: biopolymer transporter ExbD [Cyanobacteria bacterium P01_H01_bin.15]
MRLPKEPDRPFNINILPMIDVIFAILIYFIVSSLFLSRSEGLPVNLPSAQTSETQPTQELTLTVNAQGQLFLNQQAIVLENLRDRLLAQKDPNQPTVVIINADEAVNHGQVVAVMDEIRKLPEIRLAIATESPE